MNCKLFALVAITCLFAFSCQQKEADEEIRHTSNILPMNVLELSSLDEFQSPDANWSIVGDVSSDYQVRHSMNIQEGTGVLVNQPNEDNAGNLFTKMEHGDLELRLEFLVPKESNSGIYFQGRYELQILDSWSVSDPGFYDLGGIYERWDDTQPEGQRGFEGHVPKVNASKVPGLWQDFHVMFRAPRFDDEGNKIKNAHFEYVNLNGIRIHEDVELTGPTRGQAFEGEAAKAPLMIQGDHGPVAIRNVRYKKYSQTDSLTVENLAYSVYDYEGTEMPEFNKLEVIKEGVTDSFNVHLLSPKPEHFAVRFTGDLIVPTTGDYMFETHMDNSGNVYINDELVVYNSEEPRALVRANTVHLEAGINKLVVEYHQIEGRSDVTLIYEGPRMEKRFLASNNIWGVHTPPTPIVIEPKPGEPEIIGGFVSYHGSRRTQLRHVGHAEGIHYSYDMERAALLRFWRGPFADASGLWVGRGSQIFHPLNMTIDGSGGIPIVNLKADNVFNNQDIPDGLDGVTSYELVNGVPVFTSRYNDIEITDFLSPTDDGKRLRRSMKVTAPGSKENMAIRIAQGRQIKRHDSGLYLIDGRYFVKPDDAIEESIAIHKSGGNQMLYTPVLNGSNESSVAFELIW